MIDLRRVVARKDHELLAAVLAGHAAELERMSATLERLALELAFAAVWSPRVGRRAMRVTIAHLDDAEDMHVKRLVALRAGAKALARALTRRSRTLKEAR